VHDSIQLDIATGKVQDVVPFDSGNLCMVTGGRNTGRVGTIMSRCDRLGCWALLSSFSVFMLSPGLS
jgi:ribosomal protein S4E